MTPREAITLYYCWLLLFFFKFIITFFKLFNKVISILPPPHYKTKDPVFNELKNYDFTTILV